MPRVKHLLITRDLLIATVSPPPPRIRRATARERGAQPLHPAPTWGSAALEASLLPTLHPKLSLYNNNTLRTLHVFLERPAQMFLSRAPYHRGNETKRPRAPLSPCVVANTIEKRRHYNAFIQSVARSNITADTLSQSYFIMHVTTTTIQNVPVHAN
jgi:hypothetical protein